MDETNTISLAGESSTTIRQFQAGEARFRAAFENAAVGIALLDPEGRWLDVNQRLCEMLGYRRDELLGWAFQDLTHPEDLDADLNEVRRLLAGETSSYALDKRYIRKDGSTLWGHLTVSLIREPDGAVDGFVSVIEDITERRRMTEELREGQERLRLALEGGRMGLWIWDLESDRAMWNAREFELLGLEPVDGPVDTAVFFRHVHPDDVTALQEELAEVFATGGDYNKEFRVIRADGAVCWLRGLGRIYRDAHGRPIRMAGVNLDITERKLVEERLKEREAFASKVLTSSLNGLYICELREGATIQTRYINPQGTALTGYTVEDLQSQDILGLIHPEDQPRVAEHMGRLTRSKDAEVFEIEYRVRTADGRWIWCLSRDAVFERNPDGSPAQIIGTFLDITDRKAAEEALREADRRKDQFLAMLAHELRNPLTPIRNAVDLFRLRRPALDPRLARAIEMMDRQVAHMTRLLDDLLDVARLTRGTFVLRKEPVRLCEVLSRAQDAMQPVLEASDHRLQVSLPSEPLTVDGDLVRLTQAVSNLLDNAAKYSDPGTTIWLSLHREGSEGVIRVRDTGEGIAPDLLPRVFGVFVQAEQGLDRQTGGLGVGLPLARGIVDLHGGRIEAASEGPGKGSTVTVRLPLKAAVRDEAPGSAAESAGSGSNQRHVLVVDDDPDVAESFAILLEALGVAAEVVHDGPAALEAVPRLQPDVVFLDIGLPGMDGYEVARRLREHAAGRAARLVAVTGYGQDEDRSKARRAGFDRHLLKPVALEALQDALQF